ncbi:MAG: hypothetical protein AABZ77_06560, partial [Chloroflexota bacterium]
MSQKILWMIVSVIMALSLVMAACAPAAAPTIPTKPVTPATPAVPAAPTAPTAEKPRQEAASPERPKYGGIFNYVLAADILYFDPAKGA